VVLAFALFSALSRPASAQSGERAFSVFLDCTGFYCDPAFYRTEITFVDHVRDRTAADVHVLITREPTGGGGSSFALAFYGQRQFAGVADTLSLNTTQGATEDENRQAISRTVQLGLVRYLARTPDGTRATLTMAAPSVDAPKTDPTRDPWNAWVFRAGANVNGSREREFSQNSIRGSLGASRVTEEWKSSLNVSENYNDQAFSIDRERITKVTRNFSGGLLQVRSLGEHWSAGLRANASTSTYLNQHLGASVSPALEYDVYPYKESTRRQIRLRYGAGVRYYLYNDTTVYDKITETRSFESLNLAFEQKQQWGSVEAQADGFHFLDDMGKSRINYYLGANVRIVKGLSVNFHGNYQVLHDQIYLARGGASREDVLLRQSQLATSYSAFFSAGISYTFGSVLNNVVNPRFGAGDS
jgi:hypothetical protein